MRTPRAAASSPVPTRCYRRLLVVMFGQSMEKVRKKVLGLPLVLSVVRCGAQAADIQAGKRIAAGACAACHGANGVSVSETTPNLAAQAGRLSRGAAQSVQGRHPQATGRDEPDGYYECDGDPAQRRRHCNCRGAL